MLDNLVRGRRANLAAALASGPVRARRGRHPRPRPGARADRAASDLVFHQAAIRITQCAEEPRLALEVLVDGTFNVLEAAAAAEVDKVVAASSASVYGLAEEFPTAERHHPYNNDTFYGAAKSFNEGMLRSFRAMYGLDYVALRYFNVYGPRMDIHGLYTEVLIRWMERIADGRAAADLRRRPADDGLRLHRRHRPGQHARRRSRRHRRASTTSPAARRPACCDLAEALLRGDGLRPARSSTARSARSTASPAGWPTPRPPRATSASRAEIGLDDGLREPRRVVAGRSATRRAAGRASLRSAAMSRINVMQPWLGEEEVAAVAEVDRAPAGSPRGRGSPRSRRPSPSAVGADARGRGLSPAPPRCTWRWSSPASGRATRSSCRRSRSSPPPTRSATSAPRRCSPTSTWPPATSPPRPSTRCCTPRTRAVIAVHQGGVPADLRRDPRAAASRWGIARRRGRRLRAPARPYTGRPVGAGARDRRLVVPPAQDHHHRRGRHDHHRRRRAGPPALRRLREHGDERLRRRPARQRASRCWRATSRSAYNYRMTDIQAAVGLVQLGRLDAIVARRRAAGRALPRAARRASPGCARSRDPAYGHDQLPVVLGACSTRSSRLGRDELLARARRGRHLGPARHHGRAPASRRTPTHAARRRCR